MCLWTGNCALVSYQLRVLTARITAKYCCEWADWERSVSFWNIALLGTAEAFVIHRTSSEKGTTIMEGMLKPLRSGDKEVLDKDASATPLGGVNDTYGEDAASQDLPITPWSRKVARSLFLLVSVFSHINLVYCPVLSGLMLSLDCPYFSNFTHNV